MNARILFWDVDTQIDFMRPSGKLYVPQAESIIENLKALTRYGSDIGHLMSGSVDAHIPEDSEFVNFVHESISSLLILTLDAITILSFIVLKS